MGENSAISWTHHTFNGWIGCTKTSAACDHCYAERYGHRFKVKWGAGETRRKTTETYWRTPYKWDRTAAAAGERHRVFANSLSDVFDTEVPEDWRVDLFRLIRQTPNLDWLLLTKRATAMQKFVFDHVARRGEVPVNLWLGVTAENQTFADQRIPILLSTPAAKRFVSVEPMLGPVDLTRVDIDSDNECDALNQTTWEDLWEGWRRTEDTVEAALESFLDWYGLDSMLSGPANPVLDLVIVGGESGKDARPMHPDWARSLRDQCVEAGVPFHFKQWGEWAPGSTGNDEADVAVFDIGGDRTAVWFRGSTEIERTGVVRMKRVGTKGAGRLLDGELWDQMPGDT